MTVIHTDSDVSDSDVIVIHTDSDVSDSDVTVIHTDSDMTVIHTDSDMTVIHTDSDVTVIHTDMIVNHTDSDVTVIHTDSDVTVIHTDSDVTVIHTDMTVIHTDSDVTVIHTDMTVNHTDSDVTVIHTDSDVTVIHTDSDVTVIHTDMTVNRTDSDLKQFQQRSGRTPSRSPAPSARSNKSGGSQDCEEHDSRRSISPVPEQTSGETGSRGRAVSRKGEVLDGARNNSREEPAQDHTEWRTTASTESLQQLSQQLNGLLAESADDPGISDESENSTLEELKSRNRDLAALLEKHSQASEQLNTQNQQLREQVQTVQDQLQTERGSLNDRYKKDVASLKEQLQVHIQTIGILVAEKTELQSQVGQSQRIADQRIEEIEELSGRLKASRQRVADLERSLSTSSQSGQQLEKSNKENTKEIDRLKLELYKTSKYNEENQQQISELTEKLSSKTSEASALEDSVEDLKKRLEMAEIYAQQLSSESENSAGSMKMMTELQAERDALLLKVTQLEEAVGSVRQERDQVSEHYQHHSQQLSDQVQHLTQQISSLSEEREQLLSKHRDMEGALLELQRKLEASAAEPRVAESSGVDPEAHRQVVEEVDQLRQDLQDLQHRHDAQIRDNAQLSRLLEEREVRVLTLEQQVEQMGSQVEDRTSLLESVQSDRTALSRALSQNKELKAQLAELQNGFVKLSNDNMELVTKQQASQHTTNDLSARLAQQEDELTDLRDQLAQREGEVQTLREASQAAQKQQYQQDQIQDRLRHYEAQAHLVDTLQNELTAAQDMMEALTTQNSELRTMLIKATEVKPRSDGEDQNGDKSQTDDLIDSLSATIKQLETERGQLYESLKEQRHLSDDLSVKVADLQEEVIRKASEYVDTDKISRSEYEQMKTAMEMIQEKYTRVMRDKAELTDKADQLEHLVVQLQGETDTIGEYISLYHHQRALLQQRELQKNDYIAQLARDREQLQDKLGELQALVMQLLGERHMLHSYHQEASTPHTPLNGHGHAHTHAHAHTKGDMAASALTQSLANGPVENNYSEWPDYTSSDSDADSEVEPIVGGAEIPPSPSSDTSTPPSLLPNSADHAHSHAHHPHPQGRRRTHSTHSTASHRSGAESGAGPGSLPEDDETAHRILNLLSEIGHSNLVNKLSFTERNFLPCKYCKGAVQVV
ncbi:golgin subfamily A member 2-like [Babylonia areolata]|uniref:golgin subfamily A member 2-like n=1 Tax=Babylonia areolata TaxID=304850 RepID=UPI003FD4F997